MKTVASTTGQPGDTDEINDILISNGKQQKLPSTNLPLSYHTIHYEIIEQPDAIHLENLNLVAIPIETTPYQGVGDIWQLNEEVHELAVDRLLIELDVHVKVFCVFHAQYGETLHDCQPLVTATTLMNTTLDMVMSVVAVTARRIVEAIGNEFLPKTICSPKTE